MVRFDDVRNNPEVSAYIAAADRSLLALGFTEHSFAHVTRAAETASYILSSLGHSERVCELARIAGYLHDIGNLVNRVDHSQSGAVMAFRLLDKMGMAPEEIAEVVTAIGNHDEGTGVPVSPIAAALIIADKTDVRRSRVRNADTLSHDIHDRVNYSVVRAETALDTDKKTLTLDLEVDTSIGSVMDYFQIFLGRMNMCRGAAEALGLCFSLLVNKQKLL